MAKFLLRYPWNLFTNTFYRFQENRFLYNAFCPLHATTVYLRTPIELGVMNLYLLVWQIYLHSLNSLFHILKSLECLQKVTANRMKEIKSRQPKD